MSAFSCIYIYVLLCVLNKDKPINQSMINQSIMLFMYCSATGSVDYLLV